MLKPMTWEKQQRRIKDGRGQGHGDKYRPWLWVHRKNASKVSNQVVQCVPGYRRQSHFFAPVEKHVAVLVKFLGAHDVREQFPAWPMRHAHPLANTVSEDTDSIRGLIEISAEAGIRHGVEPGSQGVPYVATIDLAVTLRPNQLGFALLSLKPYEIVETSESTDRVLERLELERRYAHEVNARHKILDRSILSDILLANLESLAPFWRFRVPDTTRVEDFLGYMKLISAASEFSRALSLACMKTGFSIYRGSRLFHAAAWQQRLDVDITRRLRPDCPVTFGSAPIISALQSEIFGEAL